MAAILLYEDKTKIRLRKSMRIYRKNNLATFNPDPIWNDGALDFFEERRSNKNKKNNKMSSDMGSVPDLKTTRIYTLAVSTCLTLLLATKTRL